MQPAPAQSSYAQPAPSPSLDLPLAGRLKLPDLFEGGPSGYAAAGPKEAAADEPQLAPVPQTPAPQAAAAKPADVKPVEMKPVETKDIASVPAAVPVTTTTETKSSEAVTIRAKKPAPQPVAATAKPVETSPKPVDITSKSKPVDLAPKAALADIKPAASASLTPEEAKSPLPGAAAPEAAAPEKAPEKAAEKASAVPTLADLTLDFDGASSALSNQDEKKLDSLARQMQDAADMRLQIRGFAKGDDNGKSSARRMALSRALVVRSYLMDKGVKAVRLDVRALGSETDQAPIDRVDLVFVR
jgi:outer membrane protein OmpA-like peptidoglycan-associated protein